MPLITPSALYVSHVLSFLHKLKVFEWSSGLSNRIGIRITFVLIAKIPV